MCIFNQGGAPNYHPNSFGGPNADPFAANWTPPSQDIQGKEDYYPELYIEDNYSQPRVFWEKVLDDGGKNRLVDNLFGAIRLAQKDIQDRTVEMFSSVSEDLGARLRKKLAINTRVVHL